MRYDTETGKAHWTIQDRTHRLGAEVGYVDWAGYRSVILLGCRIKYHRVVWLIHHGYLPEGNIDHINGVKDDNRIENLRIATAAQNVHNRIRTGKYATGVYKGRQGRYIARIEHNGRKVYLGYYDTEAEAAAAYAGASIIAHGEFAAKLSRA